MGSLCDLQPNVSQSANGRAVCDSSLHQSEGSMTTLCTLSVSFSDTWESTARCTGGGGVTLRRFHCALGK